MQDRRIIVVGAVIAVVLGLLLANYVGLFGGDYGTGLNINTTTQKFEHYGHYEGKNKKFLYTQDYEMLGEVYIASWQPQGKSTTISAVAKFNFRQYYWVGPSNPIFVLGQYAWMVCYEDPNKNMHLIIDGTHNHIDTDYVVDIEGKIQGNLPNMVYKPASQLPQGEHSPPSNSWGENTWTWHHTEQDKWHSMSTGSISFKIKGNHIGAIRVYCLLEFAELYSTWTGLGWAGGNLLVVEDWAYLASGIGRVDVLGANSIRQDGTTYTEGTNREVPLYVFEEGSTVIFSVDTGYAGAMTGEKGWRLAVYKSDQTQPLKTWWLDDDLRGYEIEWTIPQGTFTPGGNNRMKVVLTNTIIDQAETTFFVVDKLNKIPGTPQVILDKSQYNEGDTVHVTLRAEANPNGTGEITKFYVEVKWDSPDSTNYVISPKYLTAHHVSGLTYETSFSFTVNRPNRYFYVLAWAMDRDGRSSGRGTNESYVKQVYGNYKITFHVVDTNGDPIERAKIEIKGVTTKYTDANGNATFWLENKQYEYTVSKDGYKAFSSSFVANADKTIEVTLQPVWSWVLILIGAIVLIAIVSGVVYYYYKKKGGIK
mgnify:CR=1 FL=1